MIGERLSEIKKDHGDTQKILASRLGVSLPTIRAWEQEKSSPSHEMLVSICQLYHVSADYLLGLTDIDPAYTNRRQSTIFTLEELSLLRKFESFLLWRRKNDGKGDFE